MRSVTQTISHSLSNDNWQSWRISVGRLERNP